MVKDYIELAKPSMVAANSLVAAAAFVFGAHGHIDWQIFLLAILGLALVMAGGCVLNNVYDRDIDAKMSRTKGRAMAAGTVKKSRAIAYGMALALLGFAMLYFVNPLALAGALAGFIFYVLLYTPLKHRSGLALYVGAVAGATPPLVGYTAASGALDIYALALFLFMFAWQIPHFLAIAKYRWSEYVAAGVPLLVSEPASEQARRRARMTFFGSLVVLLMACAVLAALPYA